MRSIVFTNQYKKDLKLARKRNLPESELNDVIQNLANDIPLSDEYHDHPLNGNYKGFRECHVRPDWLLIYGKTNNGELNILNLMRTGTHSDLFGK